MRRGYRSAEAGAPIGANPSRLSGKIVHVWAVEGGKTTIVKVFCDLDTLVPLMLRRSTKPGI